MPLASGTRLGPYEITAAIGAGGMGEVYKATDTRLNRTVAIKVLPPHFADNVDMKQRFEREAQTIAGLNHPNICTLHDVGEAASPEPHGAAIHYLVMEYLEGETLAARLSRGPLPLDEALKVAGEIVDALDKAHRQGVVHRDLKPSNVMLTTGGTARPGSPHVKLLDFGLAKWAASGQPGSLSALPTRADVTAQGTILGTLQYMAPEQVEGKEADARTDLFAFGAVLYEMVTGKKAFEGKSQASLIGAIMKAEPRPISHVQPMTPAILDHLVARCLAKDPEERWQDAHSLMIQLQWIGRSRTMTGVSPATAAAARRRTRIELVGLACGLVLLAGVSVPAFLYVRGPGDPEALQFRHTVVGLSVAEIAVSPDGRSIAFVAQPETPGAFSLFVRPVGGLTARKLAGTDSASQPFWSPDSRFIAFVAGGKLKKVEASGAGVQSLCEVQDFSGGAWSTGSAETIVFGSSKGLNRVSAEGGTPEPITTLDPSETGHLWPNFLPDGRHFMYLAWSEDANSRAVYVGALDSKEKTRLLAAESNAAYASSASSGQAAPGYVLFHRGATLFARPFDATKLAFTGEAVHIADNVSLGTGGRGNFGVSQNGVLIYHQQTAATGGGRGAPTASVQFGFVDRTKRLLGRAMEPGIYGDMDLSPDGTLIAVTQYTGAGADIWVIDWQKGTSTRLTLDPADDVNPVWSQPKGDRIAFTTWRKGNADIYVKNANGIGEETPLLESPANESIQDWSRDGRYIAYEFGQDSFQDIYALPLFGDGKPFPVVQGHFRKDEPQFSPDGKWLAYTSDESGAFQVYVLSFPALDQKVTVSTAGGGQPRWSRDGKELFYLAPTSTFMAADFTPGPKAQSGVPHVLFPAYPGATASDPTRHQWSVGPEGRFLIRVTPGAVAAPGPDGAGAPLPALTALFTPASQVNTGPAGQAGTTFRGLTVVLHWTSMLAKGGK
jgi:Tol biopolymer transport system component